MNIRTFKFGKFNYRITYKSKALSCKYPKETVIERIRCPGRIHLNNQNEIVREIIYPPELWFKEVKENDPVENVILRLNCIFDYSKIEINS